VVVAARLCSDVGLVEDHRVEVLLVVVLQANSVAVRLCSGVVALFWFHSVVY
jgi:hypothetical protein